MKPLSPKYQAVQDALDAYQRGEAPFSKFTEAVQACTPKKNRPKAKRPKGRRVVIDN